MTTLIKFLIAKNIFADEINYPTCESKVKLMRNFAKLQYYCHATHKF